MEITTNTERRLIEVWLTHADQQNEAVLASLKPIYQSAAKDKYMVAVFRSGSQNLTQLTSDLICHNRKAPARIIER